MTPIDHLRLVDVVAVVVDDVQTRCRPDRAVRVDGQATGATDEVMVVVAHPVLVASGRTGGLYTPEQSLVDENRKGVVHPLA